MALGWCPRESHLRCQDTMLSEDSPKLASRAASESSSVVSDSLKPYGLESPWNSPSQNTGVGSCSLFQGIFPTEGSNPGLLHCRLILYQLSYQGSPCPHLHLFKHTCTHTRAHMTCRSYVHVLSCFSHVQVFVILWTMALQAPLSMRIFRQEYWSGLPCPSLGNLFNPGMEFLSLAAPTLAGRFFATSST